MPRPHPLRKPSFLAAAPLLAVLAALMPCAPAHGAAPKVAVAVLGLDAIDAPEEGARALTEALRGKAAAADGVRLVAGKHLVELKLVFDCMDERPACLTQAGKSLGADRLIYGSLRRPLLGGGYTVTLKQLNVTTGAIEKFISEGVPARVLHRQSTELAASADRWLSVLLLSTLHGGLQVTTDPAGAEVTLDGAGVGTSPLQLGDVGTGTHVVTLALPGHEKVVRTLTIKGGLVHDLHVVMAPRGAAAAAPRPQGPKVDPGKPLKVLSYFLVGAAAVAGGVSIYTWRTADGERAPTRDALDMLQAKVPGSPEVTAFFADSAAMSSCRPPDELVVRALSDPTTVTAYNAYLEHCTRGRRFASATTGLLTTMGSLALLGATSYLMGELWTRKARKAAATGQSERPTWLHTPRLQVISPVITNAYGGVNMSFQF